MTQFILVNQVDILNSKLVRGIVVRKECLPFDASLLRCVGGLWMHERVAGRVKHHVLTKARAGIDRGFRKRASYVPTLKQMHAHMAEALAEMIEEIESERESEFVTRGRIAAINEVTNVFGWSKEACGASLPIRHGRIVVREEGAIA